MACFISAHYKILPSLSKSWLLIFLALAVHPVYVLNDSRTHENRLGRTEGQWGHWGSWSSCSRSCDTGVMQRSRVCIYPKSHHRSHHGHGHRKHHGRSRHKPRSSSDCVGIYKMFQTCNRESCSPGTSDFRAAQCEDHSNRTFLGRHYTWVPFTKARNKCELTCRARGHRFYMRLADKVVDGTRCEADDPYHICVAGACQRVGCDGVLGSTLRLDKCGVCGGNNTSCHIVSGIFTRQKLPYGYNKVATIPRGACMINVTEMRPSRNYLALKLTDGPYFINGDWSLGQSQEYVGGGTVFKYNRPLPGDAATELENIVGIGPTNYSIDIMVFTFRSIGGDDSQVLKQQENRGIMYEFTIPTVSNETTSAKVKSQHSGSVAPHPRDLVGAESGKNAVRADQANPASSTTGFNPELREPYNSLGPEFKDYVFGQSRNYVSAGGNIPSSGSGSFGQQAYPRRTDASSSYSYLPGSGTSSNSGTSHQIVRTHRLRHHGHQGRQQQKTRIVHSPPPQYVPEQRYDYQSLAGSSSSRFGSGGQPAYPQSQFQVGASGRNSYVGGTTGQLNPGQQYGFNNRRPPYPQASSHTRTGYPSYPGVQGSVRSQFSQTASRLDVVPGQSQRTYQSQPGIYNPNPNPRPHIIPAIASPLTDSGAPNPGIFTGQTYTNHQSRPQIPGYSGTKYNVNNFQYPGTPGQLVSPGKGPGTVNDQIALNLPSSVSRLQLGTFNAGSDYSWKILGFSECTRTCGGGTQATMIVCVKGDTQAVVTDENCDNAIRPQLQNVACNNSPCPPGWDVGEWGECSTTCDRGTQSRPVECKQRISNTVTISVSANLCQTVPKPDIQRVCNENSPCFHWKIGEWGKCSAECGRGQRSREVICINFANMTVAENLCDSPKPRTVEICDMGSCAKTWFFTHWSEECSSDCGEGVYTRRTYCTAESDRCQAIHKPSEEKPCRNDMPCGGKWFTGPWSKCTVTCGAGVMKRDVACVKTLGRLMTVVEEENCLKSEKPEIERECERPTCKARWYMTEWTECTKTCGTGFKTREVKCLDEQQEVSTRCLQEAKPEIRHICNTQSCPAPGRQQGFPSRGHQERTPRDPGCKDKFKNCQLVVQARLCNYSYYKNICCLSCSSHDNHHQHHGRHHQHHHDT